jgi:hypothetical protein
MAVPVRLTQTVVGPSAEAASAQTPPVGAARLIRTAVRLASVAAASAQESRPACDAALASAVWAVRGFVALRLPVG